MQAAAVVVYRQTQLILRVVVWQVLVAAAQVLELRQDQIRLEVMAANH
jgi:hypothetical protein